MTGRYPIASSQCRNQSWFHLTEVILPFLSRSKSGGGQVQPAAQETFDEGCEAGAIITIGSLFDGLGLSRVGMDDIRDASQPDPVHHCQSDLTDHLPGMPRHDGGAHNPVRPFPDVDLNKPFLFAIRNRAIHLAHRDLERIDCNALSPRLCFIHAHVRNLRVDIRAPGNRQGGPFLASQEEAVLDHNARRGIRGVRELVG